MTAQRLRKNAPTALFIAVVFITFFLLFSTSLRIVPLDTDDFGYLSYSRKAIPLLDNWNPTRVFPEFLMPLVGKLTASVLNISGNPVSPALAVDATSIATALVAALAISGYTLCFLIFLKKVFELSDGTSILAGAFFLVCHFIIFRISDSDNYFLFWALNMTCFYYYTLSSLLSASLVFLLAANDNGSYSALSKTKPAFKCLIICMAYFSLLSNLFSSIILLAYVFTITVADAIKYCRASNVRAFIKNNSVRLILLILGAAVQIFETQGGRAESLKNGSFLSRFQEGIQVLLDYRFSNMFLGLLLAIIIVYLFLFLRNKVAQTSEINALALLFIISMCLTALYLSLLCGAAGANFMKRTDATFGIWFYLVFIMSLLFANILERTNTAKLCLPLALIVLTSYTVTSTTTYKSINYLSCTPAEAREISVTILEQMQTASNNNQSEIDLEVPVTPGTATDNWPWSTSGFATTGLTNFSYTFGITKRPIEIASIVPSANLNIELGIRASQS
jgi:hypothetical protein